MQPDLAETVRILREARARATFHPSGKLASIEFDDGGEPAAAPGNVQDPVDGQRPKDPLRDIVLAEPAGLELEAGDLVEDEPAAETRDNPDSEAGGPGQGPDGTT